MHAWTHTHNWAAHSSVTPITAPTCQFKGVAFGECNSCRTCLEVATEIEHLGVKKCQSASPWFPQSNSWQCACQVWAQECSAHLSTSSCLLWQMSQRGFCNLALGGFHNLVWQQTGPQDSMPLLRMCVVVGLWCFGIQNELQSHSPKASAPSLL